MEHKNQQNIEEQIRLQRTLIRQDFDILKATLKEAEESGTVSYDSFTGFFEQLQEQFDMFSGLIKKLEAPEISSELSSIKGEVSSCFDAFYRLRTRFYNTISDLEAGPEVDLQNISEEEEPELDEEESLEASLEDVQEIPPEEKPDDKKKKRVIRPPAKPSTIPVSSFYQSQQLIHEEIYTEEQKAQKDANAARLAANLASYHEAIYRATHSTEQQPTQQEQNTQKSVTVPGTDAQPKESAAKNADSIHRSDNHPVDRIPNMVPVWNPPKETYPMGSPDRPHRSAVSPKPQKQEMNPGKPQKQNSHLSAHQYQLKRVTRNLGYGVYATVQNGMYRAAAKTDNDVIKAGLDTSYYLSTGAAAIGMIHGAVRPPTASVKASSGRVLSKKQMAKYNAGAIRKHKELSVQISALEAELSSPAMLRRRPAERKQLEMALRELKAQGPAAARSAKFAHKVRNFQHERDLDNTVLEALTVNGKIPRGARKIQELSTQFTRTRSKEIAYRFGEESLNRPLKSINAELSQLRKTGHSLKSQIHLLQRQGSKLSQSERKQLQELKKRLKELGQKIGTSTALKQALEDQNYMQGQMDQVVKRAFKQRQNVSAMSGFLRNIMLRPLYNPDNNTEALAYGLRMATNPRTLHKVGTAARVTAQAPVKILHKAAPRLATELEFKKDLAKRKAKNAAKQAVKKSTDTIQDSIKAALERRQKHRKKIGGVQKNPAHKLAVWKRKHSSARKSTAHKSAAEAVAGIREFLSKAASLLKGVSVKAVLIAGLLALIIGLVIQMVAVISGISSNVVLSPHEGENGKIDLAPFVSVVEQEKRKFTAMRDGVEQEFYEKIEKAAEAFNHQNNRPPKVQIINGPYEDKDSKISVTFDGPSNCDRELIAMMAVRFQQDLEHPEAKAYLQYMASKSRVLNTAVEKTIQHRPGCVELQVEVKPEKPENPDPVNPSPGGGSHVVPGVLSTQPESRSHVTVPEKPEKPKEPVYERRKVCPGHHIMEIHIHTLTLSELYAADDYPGGIDGWDGWTEQNQQWVEALMAMDWAEIYTGFRTGGIISAASAISPEEEQHIWDYLNQLTGNPYGAAGIMGNLHCESRLLSINLEDQYESILGYSNETYTDAVDSGAYLHFEDDSAGYGIAQWTYSSRKAGLLRMAKSRGVSIGNLDMQLDYLASELQGSGLNLLSSCNSVEEASDYMLFQFENPANAQSLQATRAGISSYYYNKYMLGTAAEGDLTQAQMEVIRIATNSEAYGIPARGGYCQAWAAYIYGRAGHPIDNSSCARVSGERYGVSSDFTAVPPGAAVYGYSSSRYGHVGIYVGGGLVYHNVGGVAVDSLADWVRIYNGFAWGWQAGTDLTALP